MRGSRREVVLCLVFLSVLGFAYFALDAFAGVSVESPFVAIVIGLAFVIGWPGLRRFRARTRASILVPFVLAAVALGWVDVDNPGRKAFLRALFSIKPGMTRNQVDAVMGKYPHPRAGNPVWFRYTNNSDFGMVEFDGDRVRRVEFLPD